MSTSLPLSNSQRAYFASSLLLSPPHRSNPSRAPLAFRPLSVEKGIVEHASGSARVELGGTSVEAVVSAEVVDGPGGWEVDVDCSTSIVPPPALLSSLTSLLQSLVTGPSCAVPPEALTIISSGPVSSSNEASTSSTGGAPRKSWLLHLDATLHSIAGGNVADALLAAAFAAVWDTRLPRTRPILYGSLDSRSKGGAASSSSEPGPAGAGEKLDMFNLKERLPGEAGAAPTGRGLEGQAVDFELVDTEDPGEPLKGRQEWPVGVTVCVLPQSHLLDPTAAEEEVIPPYRRMLIVSSSDGSLRGVRTLGGAGEGEASEADDGGRFARAQLTTTTTREEDAKDAIPASAWGTMPYDAVKQTMRIGATYARQLHASLVEQLK